MARLRGSTFQIRKGVREKPTARQLQLKDIYIHVYLNEGHDVNNAAQMKEATVSNGGIPGVIVSYRKLPEISAAKTVTKWEGISVLNNFQVFQKLINGITTWKANNVGAGKLISWKDIQNDGIFSAKLEVLEPPDTRS